MNARRPFVKTDDGQDLIEYGMLLGLIAVVALASLQALGAFVAGTFRTLLDLVNG